MNPLQAPSAVAAGIYLHWPFCARKCPYCDFYTFGRGHPDFELSRRYLDALLAEIDRAAARLPKKPPVDSVYFGGGTPSLLEAGQIRSILSRLETAFEIAPDAEITVEVNPTAADAARLREYPGAGVNRLSVGCQSFDDRLLTLLGRDHDAATARRVLGELRATGFDNLSLDLMFGLPGQSVGDVEADLDAALSFAPEHVSVYGLTLHEGTPFLRWHEQGRWTLPETDEQAAMFELLMDRLADAGYAHYEISNWARPGRECRHNAKYWRRCDVYAFGASAHGVVGGRRCAHPRDLRQYVEGASLPEEESPPDARAARGEIMMLALRRVAGVAWAEIEDWMGADPREVCAEELARLMEDELIERNADRLRLTRRGILMADEAMERFF